jgi:NAD(P)-dependent dehydrogenase (short-subunit alcohol dehydrogenase family)
LQKTASEIEALGRRALIVKLDILEKKDIENVVESTIKEFGRVDVMVNNAAKFGREGSGLLVDTPIEEYEKEVWVNVLAPLYFTKLVVPTMTQQRGGIIVNVSSEAARWDAVGLAVGYSMTKAGLGRLASGLSRELREHNIAVISIEPGCVDNGHLPDDIKRLALSVDVPGTTIAYLATHPHPVFFSGKTVDAPTFVVEHDLVDALAMPPPYGPTHWGIPPRPPRPLGPRDQWPA